MLKDKGKKITEEICKVMQGSYSYNGNDGMLVRKDHWRSLLWHPTGARQFPKYSGK